MKVSYNSRFSEGKGYISASTNTLAGCAIRSTFAVDFQGCLNAYLVNKRHVPTDSSPLRELWNRCFSSKLTLFQISTRCETLPATLSSPAAYQKHLQFLMPQVNLRGFSTEIYDTFIYLLTEYVIRRRWTTLVSM